MKQVMKGFSNKRDGSMYVPRINPSPENIVHRKTFLEAQGLGDKQTVMANLVHGTNVALVTTTSDYRLSDTDGLVTKESDIILTVTGADCFPVYFEEKVAGIVGIAHCGWRGIINDIIPKMFATITAMGGEVENIVITIGPGICTGHFAIGTDILSSFAVYPEYIIGEKNIHVDLKGIIKRQAAEAGISVAHIADQNECTYCLPNKYFSYRRDKPTYMETQIAYITQSSHHIV